MEGTERLAVGHVDESGVPVEQRFDRGHVALLHGLEDIGENRDARDKARHGQNSEARYFFHWTHAKRRVRLPFGVSSFGAMNPSSCVLRDIGI